MQTLLLTFAVFVVVALLMAVGVMVTGRSLRGSCGGPDCVCEAEGKALGSCDLDDKGLPIHPGNSRHPDSPGSIARECPP